MIKKESMKKDNILPFERLASDPKEPNGKDWLREMEHGSRFLCQQKGTKSPFLRCIGIAAIIPEAICLAELNEDKPGYAFSWVDSPEFSKQYRFVGLLPEGPEKEENG